jgi:hypothetical protein
MRLASPVDSENQNDRQMVRFNRAFRARSGVSPAHLRARMPADG